MHKKILFYGNNIFLTFIFTLSLKLITLSLCKLLQFIAHNNQMNNSNQDIKMRAFKVIIVGPQAVGKSSILFRLS